MSGMIADQADNGPLTNASVVLLDQDSIMKYFVRADENGKFQIKTVAPGSYLLLVSYPKFEVYSQKIEVENKDLNLESIKINSQINLIEEVIIKQKLPITIKGDTIEYDAGSFETEKNAKLEDLLRRLPGLTVSGDGAITAQGKSVSKVLIDGEEFFGYDPKIAIRNIRADAVDKVQVYERKSEQAELTGVDDGVRLQTVNVVLKEEARNGIFGNIEGLYGTRDLYTANLFAAKFNQTERIGITGNINNMGSSGREGSIRMNSQITGAPYSTSFGTNYENRLFKKRLHVNANYNLNNNGNRNESENYRKELVTGNVLETVSRSASKSDNQSNGLRSQFKFRIDSSQSLDVYLNANLSKRESQNSQTNEVSNEDLSLARYDDNRNESNSTSSSNDIRINYRKRLNKKGQSLNLHLNNSHNQSDTENKVANHSHFYAKDSTAILNQNRFGDNTSNNFSAELNFNNRLSDQLNYSIGYNFANSYGKNLLNAYNSDDLNTFEQLDSTYSQNQTDAYTNQGLNLNLNYNFNNLHINVTNKTFYKDQKLEDSYRNIDLNRNFWDNNLNMDLNYKISNAKNIRLSYQNSNIIPSFGQLQPLQPQDNQYDVQLGNPDLKKSINNSIRANYNQISLMKGTSMNLNGNVSFITNPIVNQRIVNEETTKSTNTFVNIDNKSNWNANLNANYNSPLFQKQLQFNQFAGISYSNGYSYINNELNNSQSTNGNIGLGLNEQNSKGFDFNIDFRVGLNNQNNSIRREYNYTNFTGGSSGHIKYFLPKKFNILVNATYSYTGPTKLYTRDIHQFYTNIELGKTLLKNESLVASVKVFDVFNTFNNVNRSVSENSYSESSQLVLTQYVLFGLKWDFNKNLGKKND